MNVVVPALSDAYSTCVALRSTQSAACQFDLEQTPLVANRGGYPPGFYAFLRIFASEQASASIVVMRMVIWTVGSAMWIALFALLPERSRSRMMLAALVGMVPLGLFIAASTNPSAALITGVPVAALAAAFAPPLATRRGKAALGLAAAAALIAVLSRSDAPFLLGVASVGAALLATARQSWSQSWRVPSVVLVIAVLGLAFGGSQAGALTTGLSPGSGAEVLGLGAALQQLPRYFIGGFATTVGYMDVPMPPAVWGSIAVAFAGVLLMGMWSWSARKALAVAAVLGGQIVGLLYLETTSPCCNIQTRYFLPLTLTWLLFAVWVPPGVRAWRLNRGQGAVLWLLMSVAQGLALRQVLERYTVGLESSLSTAWLTDPQWWWNVPVPPVAVWLLGSLAYAGVSLLVLGAVLRESRDVRGVTEGAAGSQ